jgi:hypothetical protein
MILFTVYKTTNLVNGKYYFGVHKTKDPNDNYLGSGTYIERAVAKHGMEKFRKDVLFVYLEAESAFAKEDELIQCYRGCDPLCMNLRKGGSGGFDWINRNGINNKAANGLKANRNRIQKIANDPTFRQRWSEISKLGAAKARLNPKFGSKESSALGAAIWNKTWTGRKHTQAATEKMSVAKRGDRNTIFGRRWMKHPDFKPFPVKADDVEAHLAAGWTFGR